MASCPRCGTWFDGPARVLVDAVPPFMGGNPGPAPIPIYRDNLCANCYREQWELRQAQARVAAEHAAKLREQQRLRDAARADAEREVDGQLPAVPGPGVRPIPPDLMHPDWGWYVGTAMYAVVGGVILAVVFSSLRTGFIVSFSAGAAVLGVWLLQAAAKRSRHGAEMDAYEDQMSRHQAYLAERAKRIDQQMAARGFS